MNVEQPKFGNVFLPGMDDDSFFVPTNEPETTVEPVIDSGEIVSEQSSIEETVDETIVSSYDGDIIKKANRKMIPNDFPPVPYKP